MMARVAAVFVCWIALIAWVGAQRRAPGLPGDLTDNAFWQLIVTLSEPDGYFEDENFVSNETGYERVLPRLQQEVEPGGVYVGVGPEQNFTYIAALRPAIAFVVDVRRQNMVEHLMYKALFEMSDDRADFLARLFSRPRPANLDPDVPVAALFHAFTTVRSDRRLFDDTLARMLDVLTRQHRFALTDADQAALRKVLQAFYESGPDIRYVFRGTTELHPTYARLMTEGAEAGKSWSYLGTSASFEHVRLMQRKNLIVPVVGDFAGQRALKGVGSYIRDRGGAVSVFYVSNVESYLFRAGTWKAFYDNVLSMPLQESSVFVRTFFGATARECSAQRPTIRAPVLSPMATLLTAFRAGTLKTQCDLVTASK